MSYKSRTNWRIGLCLPSCKCPQCRKKEFSSCCNASVGVMGKTTHYYICLLCGNSCDIKIGGLNE